MKALSLFSGGLDSILATRLILNQNIEIEAIYFHNPFCDCSMPNAPCKASRKAAGFLKIPIHIIELKEDFLKTVRNPKHGYGKNINPCIDCRILQFKKAKSLMDKFAARFIITGEVVNERPMSQRKKVIYSMDKEADVEGIILRPLSAKRLKETQPEKKGWVDRQKLLDIEGRSRKTQMELAKKFGIEEYPTPSGGCLLTYAGFADKVKDLIKHNQLTLEHVRLLKIGRHFRLPDKIKFIIGKDNSENERLLNAATETTILMKADDFPSPIGFLPEGGTKESIELAASVLAFYVNKADNNSPIGVKYWGKKDGFGGATFVKKAPTYEIDRVRITK